MCDKSGEHAKLVERVETAHVRGFRVGVDCQSILFSGQSCRTTTEEEDCGKRNALVRCAMCVCDGCAMDDDESMSEFSLKDLLHVSPPQFGPVFDD
jgi:hypothetical protein